MDKKDGDFYFDVTMGSYDGAEICELVGLYILHVLGEKCVKDKIGLYRDDGLACLGNINGSQAERIRKGFISILKTELKINITSETNLKIVNFLNVTLNLNKRTHETYNKPNNNPLYININSNHLQNIMKNLQENIPKKKSYQAVPVSSTILRIYIKTHCLEADFNKELNWNKVTPQQHQIKTKKGT